MKLKNDHGDVTGEMRAWAVRQLRGGKVKADRLAEELGVSVRSLRRWASAAKLEENNEPLTKAERVELEELRNEAQRLREEIEILKKFRAFSASQER